MTDFVITDEQVGQALENAISLPKMHDLMEVVLARPLSVALKAERERVLSCVQELEQRKCRTCGGIVTSPKCDRCYANNIENIKEEILRRERERVLDDYCKWDDTHWTTQRIKEYKKSLRNGVEKHE